MQRASEDTEARECQKKETRGLPVVATQHIGPMLRDLLGGKKEEREIVAAKDDASGMRRGVEQVYQSIKVLCDILERKGDK